MKYKLTPYNLQELGQRQNQEDSLFPGIGQQTVNDRLFILCDGMGGHEKGEVASATVCETMSNTILSRWNPAEPLSDEFLQQAIEDAYDALDAKDNGEEKKMGTTMTFVCFHAEGVTVAHIGDSRIYQLRPATKKEPARIVFKTRDHSLVNDLIDIGEITEEEAKNHPQKNVITRAMQPCQERRAKATIAHLIDIQEGDYLYMCSDGMLEQTSDENLLNIITKKDARNEEKVEMLRNVTADNKDNHTAHLIYINKVEEKPVIPQVQKPISRSEEQTRILLQPTTPQGTWVTPEYAKPKKKRSFLPFIVAAIVLAAIAVGASYLLWGGQTEKNESGKDSDSINATRVNHPNTEVDSNNLPSGNTNNETRPAEGKVENQDATQSPDAPNVDATQDNGGSNSGNVSHPSTEPSGSQRGNNSVGASQQQFLTPGKNSQAKEPAKTGDTSTKIVATKQQK